VEIINNKESYSWKGKPVFVTGATGLLGSWLVPELVRKGADVIALVRDQRPQSLLANDGWLDQITVVHGSLTDYDLLKRTMAEYSIETIFHLAAQTLVGIAKTDPVGTLEANVRGSWLLLEAARYCNVSQIVVASSDKAYGCSDQLPYLESHPLQGKYPYDCSKSCMDLISHMYAETFGLPVVIARCGNLFGGGDLNFSRTIPGAIRSTLEGERFRIRSDGSFVRDFLYVEDAVDAYIRLAEKLAQNRSLAGGAFNFSLGLKLTVLELTEMILEMMGTHLKPVVENTASAEIREQYMVAHKARDILQWKPVYGLEEGLRRTINWYRAFLDSEKSSPVGSEVVSLTARGGK